MSTQTGALIQVVLEGVPLPATKAELVDYARREDPDAAALLDALPERDYRSLDEVGEALAPVQPQRSQPDPAVPHEESDKPPGGEAYIEPHPEPGAVRHDAPPDNPPQRALEKQSKAQSEQLERQKEKLGPES